MPEILARRPGARLAIAGDGHQRPEVRARIHAHGLESQVHLLGRVGEAELRDRYRAADLTVTPTQQLEGFGLATAESLAVGTPALVTPVGANPEVVGDLHPLLVAPGPGPGDLAKAVGLLVDQTGLLEALRGRARAHAHPRWSWPSVADRYLDLYRETVAP